jgi:hypothetical protein
VAPLTDLNIVRAEIPKALAAARAAPYAMPADMSCPGLAADIQALDAVLGADLDTAETRDNPSLIERGGDAASNALVGAVRDTTEGVVPFRGWVRKLSGAERYARKVSASIAAGTIRRAYLKGLGQAAGCAAPAAPHTARPGPRSRLKPGPPRRIQALKPRPAPPSVRSAGDTPHFPLPTTFHPTSRSTHHGHGRRRLRNLRI